MKHASRAGELQALGQYSSSAGESLRSAVDTTRLPSCTVSCSSATSTLSAGARWSCRGRGRG
eukprot:7241-Pleurochrysis_carterae.AAC.1